MNNLPKRKSIRLKHYDYSLPGWYYVTICTRDRKCVFGDIIDGEMVLNDVGEMIRDWWLKIPERFENVALDQYQIMPNHIHGIIVIVGVGLPNPHDDGGRNYKRAGKPRPYYGNGTTDVGANHCVFQIPIHQTNECVTRYAR